MERFDVNCVIGPWPTGGPTLADGDQLLAAMDRLGIARALVRHTAAIHYALSEGNAQLTEALELCRDGQGRLFPCWAAAPSATGELGPLDAWLDSVAQHGVRAISLYPQSHGYPLAPWQLNDLLHPLNERRMVILFETAQVAWNDLHWLCGEHPGLPVVVMETGYRVLRPLMALLEAHENLHVDISTMSNFYGIEELCRRFGAGRLLFGTGQPRTDGAGVVSALNYARLSAEEVEAISWGNLERLLEEVRL